MLASKDDGWMGMGTKVNGNVDEWGLKLQLMFMVGAEDEHSFPPPNTDS